jgi:hypothetical protein
MADATFISVAGTFAILIADKHATYTSLGTKKLLPLRLGVLA